ncbi:MAG: serine/threonine-protein kinase [Gammaproteobacteria bacterium]|nr:serine/threonine-protein kinase [Gammaproteobacteria bacterium]
MKVPGKVGKYITTKELGRGATGIVYLCHDPYHHRDVALKLYTTDDRLTEEQQRLRKRLFFNEAHLVGMLTHPNILPIYDAGEDDGQCYIVMEYVRNATPMNIFCRPQNLLPIRKVVEVVFKCAKALDHAHRKGIVHRDIKPSNILVNAEHDIRIVDFGIAQNPTSEMSTLSGLVGSPSYMAPEQVREDKVTHKADIYALGVVMYELLTGKRPFYGENLTRLIHQIVYATPMPLRELRSEVPEALQRIISKAMEKDADNRYNDCFEFSVDLTHAFNELGRLHEEIAEQERFNMVKQLRFFKDFSYPEIWEVLNASDWQVRNEGETIVTEGELDDSFYIIVSGEVVVTKGGKTLGRLNEGDCFGEMGYISKTERTASVTTKGGVALMRVNATLIEQASLECQLRFHKVFLHTLISRLSRTSEMFVLGDDKSGTA